MDWSMEDVTITTTCQNRQRFLVSSIKTWVESEVKEIIVLDWGSSSPIKYSQLPDDSRIRLFRHDWVGPWPGMAWPHGASIRLVKTPIVLKLDCDIVLVGKVPTSLPDGIAMYHGAANDKGKYKYEIYGSFMGPKTLFEEMNGYDERMSGWGGVDVDFYARLDKAGYKTLPFPVGTVWVQHHDRSIRAKSNWKNNERMSAREGPWGKHFPVREFDISEIER